MALGIVFPIYPIFHLLKGDYKEFRVPGFGA